MIASEIFVNETMVSAGISGVYESPMKTKKLIKKTEKNGTNSLDNKTLTNTDK